MPPERLALERVRGHVLAKLKALPHGEHQRVAGLAGVSTTHFSNWVREEAEFNPKLESLVGLATALKLPVAALLWTQHDAPPLSAAELADIAQQLRASIVRLEAPRPAAPQPAADFEELIEEGRAKRKRSTGQGGRSTGTG